MSTNQSPAWLGGDVERMHVITCDTFREQGPDAKTRKAMKAAQTTEAQRDRFLAAWADAYARMVVEHGTEAEHSAVLRMAADLIDPAGATPPDRPATGVPTADADMDAADLSDNQRQAFVRAYGRRAR